MSFRIKKTIGIIGTNGLPGKYGGWDQLVNHLTINLREDFNFIVYTSYSNSDYKVSDINNAKLKIIKLKANGFQSIFYDMISMVHAVRKCDILFICGISGAIFLPLIKLFKKKIVLNPDGLEWKRKKFNYLVKLFLKISERIGVKYSDLVVADNKMLGNYFKAKYGINCEIIEYGGDHVIFDSTLGVVNQEKYAIFPKEYAFKVCRIEPENNIDLILEAFTKSSIILVIVGNWNYSNYGKKLRNKYKNNSNLRLLDPIYTQKTLDEIRNNCLIYIHGHSVGGTNPSLVEAMNLGLVILAFDVEFNRETTENSALYFKNSKELYKLLNQINNSEIRISDYSNKMKEIASRRYIWELITKKYLNAFNLH